MRGVDQVKLKKVARQFARYFLVAGLGYIVDFAILFILHELLDIHYLLSAGAGFIVGLIIVYIMSSIFVFKDSKIKSRSMEVGLFIFIGIIGLLLLSLIMWALTGLIGVSYIISKIIATIFVYLWNFFARRSMYNN